MPDYRLPKKLLFATLAPGAGAPRPPGTLPAKRLREAYVKDMIAVGLPKEGWLQYCQSAEGRPSWRKLTREVAVWFTPCLRRQGVAPPDGEGEPSTYTARRCACPC